MTTQEQHKTFRLKLWKLDAEITPDELWICLVVYPLFFLTPLGVAVIDSATVMVLFTTVIIFSLPVATALFYINTFVSSNQVRFLLVRRPVEGELSRDHFAIINATFLFVIDLFVLHSLLLTWVVAVLSFAALVLNFNTLVKGLTKTKVQ
jgi:hypothetical protein